MRRYPIEGEWSLTPLTAQCFKQGGVMKRTSFIRLSVLLLMLLIPVITNAAGQEDPYYVQWASFKIGSNTSYAGAVEEPTGVSSFTQTITLKEISQDYLKVSIARIENEKTVNKIKNVDRFARATDKVQSLGTEAIMLAGKSFTCQKYVLAIFDKSGKEMIQFVYWFHPDIPGAARIVSSGSGIKVTQSAVSWEKK